jgi:thymidylate synthase
MLSFNRIKNLFYNEKNAKVKEEIKAEINEEECQYLNLVKEIIEKGTIEDGRNGLVKSVFGRSMKFSLKDGQLPILTTKKVAWKTCFKELLFFIKGQTDNNILKEQDVNIWTANSTREFLNNYNLNSQKENDLGPIYGFQWRYWNAKYDGCDKNYEGCGIDQLKYIIDSLKNKSTRSSRRLIMTAWNPEQLNNMVLPPCHVMIQFNVRDKKYLSACLFQRSCDMGLGVPFNILSYSLLIHILAKHCGLVADEFVYFMGNAHIYINHIVGLNIQLKRSTKPFSKIAIKQLHNNIEDYSLDDIIFVEPYLCDDTIKMELVP